MADQIQGFRLSPQQERLWALGQDGGSACRAQCAVAITRRLDEESLRGALQTIVDRHEILRTVFQRPPGSPTAVQVVRDRGSFLWSRISIDEPEPAGRDRALDRVLAEEREHAFNLEEGPLLHARLAVTGEEERILLLTLPSLCADAASLYRLVEELALFFSRSGEVLEEPVQYSQYTEWRHQTLEDEEGEEARQLWRRTAPVEALPERLPWERPAESAGSLTPSALRWEVPPDRLQRIEALARQRNASVSAFLLAAWQVLVGRLTARREIAVGCVLDGRRLEDLRETLGPVAETVPVLARIAPEDPFTAVMDRAREALDGAYEWQEHFAARELAPPPAGGWPLGFELSAPAPRWAGGAHFSIVRCSVWLDRYRLKLAGRMDEALSLELQYDPAFVRVEEAEHLAARLDRILDAVLVEPGMAIGEIELLGRRETALFEAINRTHRDFPADRCLHELFEKQADRSPDEVAVTLGERRLTFAELDREANRLAHELAKQGVGPEVLVAVHLERSPEMVVALLAVLKSGGAYLPLEVGYPAERLEHMVGDARPAVLLTREGLLPGTPGSAAATVLVDRDRERIAGCDASRPARRAGSDTLAYVLYTSGSTGRPKGVMVTHRGLVSYLAWAVEAYSLEAGGGAPVQSPLAFDLTVTALFAPLLAGRTVDLLPEGLGIEALAEALRSPRDYSLVKVTPGHLELLEQQLGGRGPTARVRSLVLGGEALLGQSLASWARSGEIRIFNEFGPTETVVGSCVHEYRLERDGRGPVPIGRPIANTRIHLFDERLRRVPLGVEGELYIAGTGVTRGYLNRPDLTAERFLPDPFAPDPGGRMYRTGDLARHLPEGDLLFLGRADRQIKVRGVRVELGEVEAALRRHPGVREAVLTAREEALGDWRSVAYLVGSGGEVEELRRFLLRSLPEPMVPAHFVWLEEIPLTPNGKVDQRRLPAPDARRPDLAEEYLAPRNAVEQTLAEVWAEVLRLEKIGVRDNFFSLGGDSIRSVRLVAAARERGLCFEIQDLFLYRTIADLAGFLERSPAAALPLAAVEEARGSETDAELEELLTTLEGLSAEQVRQELRQRLAGEEKA